MIALLVLLVGCGESVQNTESKASGPKAPKVVVAPVPEKDSYVYSPAGKRDPFQSFLIEPDDASRDGILDPLQRWTVSEYLLVGTITNTPAPRALLTDPEGTGHVVRIGTYVGRNWGKVTAIEPDAVVVTEEYQTYEGELVVNAVNVRFPKRKDK